MHSPDLFIRKSVALFDEYLTKIEQCLNAMSDDDLWWRPNEASNSAGNLVLHLCGNVTQWIVGGVGGRPYHRHRQQEFDEPGPIPRPELIERLKGVVSEAVAIIGAQSGPSLEAGRRIQGYDVTVLEAIYHVVEHFSMHTGQIITLAKLKGGRDLQLWQAP